MSSSKDESKSKEKATDDKKKKGRPRKKPSKYRRASTNPFLNDDDTNNAVVEGVVNECWVCAECKQTFSEDYDMLMECEFCASHYCIKCIDMTVVQYQCMKRPDCLWRFGIRS